MLHPLLRVLLRVLLRLLAPLVHALYRVALLLRLGIQLAERDLHASAGGGTSDEAAAQARLLNGGCAPSQIDSPPRAMQPGSAAHPPLALAQARHGPTSATPCAAWGRWRWRSPPAPPCSTTRLTESKRTAT
jgi:hypothetical protein